MPDEVATLKARLLAQRQRQKLEKLKRKARDVEAERERIASAKLEQARLEEEETQAKEAAERERLENEMKQQQLKQVKICMLSAGFRELCFDRLTKTTYFLDFFGFRDTTERGAGCQDGQGKNGC